MSQMSLTTVDHRWIQIPAYKPARVVNAGEPTG